MSKAKHAQHLPCRLRSKKLAAMALASLALAGSVVGGSMAWLVEQTDAAQLDFTAGDINITLNDPDAEASMLEDLLVHPGLLVPGDTIARDLSVTVEPGSEACYLFVKVTEQNNRCDGLLDPVIQWSVRTGLDGWTPYEDWLVSGSRSVTGEASTYYYYRVVEADTAAEGATYPVLTGGDTLQTENGCLLFNPEVTKQMLADLQMAKPGITVTAAAVQLANLADVDAAWACLPQSFTE